MPSNKKDEDLRKSIEIKTKLKAILPKPPGFIKKEERSEVQHKLSISQAFEPQKKSAAKKISSSVEGKDLRSAPFKHDDDVTKKKVSQPRF